MNSDSTNPKAPLPRQNEIPRVGGDVVVWLMQKGAVLLYRTNIWEYENLCHRTGGRREYWLEGYLLNERQLVLWRRPHGVTLTVFLPAPSADTAETIRTIETIILGTPASVVPAEEDRERAAQNRNIAVTAALEAFCEFDKSPNPVKVVAAVDAILAAAKGPR